MRAENAPPAVSEPEPDTALVPPEFRQTVSMLVIDDERTLRESCRTVLEADGYRVEVCGRGDEALDMVRRRRTRSSASSPRPQTSTR